MDPVQARLSQLGSMQARTLEELELQQPLFERTLRPLAGRLSGVGQRLHQPEQGRRTEQRLAMAGNPGDLRTVDFLGLKLLLAGIFSVGALLILGVVFGNSVFGFFAGIGFALLGFVLPDFWLGRHVSDRQKAILRAVPDTLDLLTISVRAGLGFDGALAKVVEKTQGPLAEEFRRVLAEVRMGKARRDALRDVVARTDVPALTNFIGAIIQAEQLGVADQQGAPDPVRAAAHRAPPASRGAGGQGADQDALPVGRLHLPLDVHRHPGAGDHPDRAELHDDGVRLSKRMVALVYDGRVVVGRH